MSVPVCNMIHLNLDPHPVLQDFDSLWERVKGDNNCNRNYYNHIATWYGDVDYAYTGVRHKAQRMPQKFKEIARHLESKLVYSVGYFNSLLINLYTGKGIARHSDDEPIFMENDGTVGAVATVSLGGTAIATINSKDPKCFRLGKNFNIKLKNGSCYLMPEGNFQNEYTHQVSKPNALNPRRISLTFRHIP